MMRERPESVHERRAARRTGSMTARANSIHADGPTLVRAPFHRDGWVYEEKVDGWRILAYKDGDRVRLISRNGRDHTRRFRNIPAAIAKLSARWCSTADRDLRPGVAIAVRLAA